jgi:hypothetical protein
MNITLGPSIVVVDSPILDHFRRKEIEQAAETRDMMNSVCHGLKIENIFENHVGLEIHPAWMDDSLRGSLLENPY